MGSECLMIFTKNPILGSAKTRIGKVKGDNVALQVYLKLLIYTRDITKDLTSKKVVYFNKFKEENGIWEDESYLKRIQKAGDLGVKMGAAFEEELQDSERVIIIGSDCATISSADIKNAFLALNSNDLVIGPANDGGYYLIGMKKYHASIFMEMPWSQENLLEETIATAKAQELSYSLLPMKSDIDYWEDWEKLGWTLD